jgi:hypothetical protein
MILFLSSLPVGASLHFLITIPRYRTKVTEIQDQNASQRKQTLAVRTGAAFVYSLQHNRDRSTSTEFSPYAF